MVDAPERIWAYPSNVTGWRNAYANELQIMSSTEYVRADIAEREKAELLARANSAEQAEWATKDWFWTIADKYIEAFGPPEFPDPDLSVNWKARAEDLSRQLAEMTAERDELLEEGRAANKLASDRNRELIDIERQLAERDAELARKTAECNRLKREKLRAEKRQSQYAGRLRRETERANALGAALSGSGDGGWRSKALDDVAAERRRQVEAEGWTPEHDDQHSLGELASAASCYAHCDGARRWVAEYWDNSVPVGRVSVPIDWPWDGQWWKPSDDRRNLVKAGALIIAEIERIDRLPAAPAPTGGNDINPIHQKEI